MRQTPAGTRSVVIAITLVAFNLRTPLTALPTVVTDIEAGTGLGKVALGALTTMPIVMMGALAFLVPRVAARWGLARVVWVATATLALASAIRLAGAVPVVLYLSALMAGGAIALAGGCVPAIVRQQLPRRIGFVTGLWTTSLMTGAALAAATTVPLSHWLGTWQAALAFWALPAAAAWLIWAVVERRGGPPPAPAARAAARAGLPWRSPLAWSLTAFLAINSVLYYTTVAWLAPSLEARGLTQAEAGAAFGLATATGIAAALVFPPWLQRTLRPRAMLAANVVLVVASLVGIALLPNTATPVWMVLFGIANTAWFTTGQTLIGILSVGSDDAAQLTAMVYSGMYLLAALGPVSGGALLEATGSYTALFLTLAAFSALGLLTVGRLSPRR